MTGYGRAGSPAISEQEFDISGSLVPTEDVDFQSNQGQKKKNAYGVTPKNEFGVFDSGDSSDDAAGAGAGAGAVDNADDDDDGDAAFIAAQQAALNRKNTAGSSTSGRKSGGFQSMGLNPLLLRAITRKGFSVPTPIQRKTIPAILDRKDVVGMARTGSGKTAAFIIPMIERLKSHSAQVGARAIILSPSRELALQTLRASKDFGRGTDLRSVLLVGGDSLESQFSQMTSNPDIIIATPGRFLHLIVEMSLDLHSVQYIVFDEADRLFEMGFATQLTEILHVLPLSRQTLLFSATLPRSLVEFAKAGLQEPELIRLDAESKISSDLQSAFLHVKASEKEASLLHILHDLIEVPQRELQEKKGTSKSKGRTLPYSTIVFAATKHHVEYLGALLSYAGFAVSYLYSSLDQTARQIQAENFRKGVSDVLVVTDVAARGIDIPMLANVINYDFPPQSKVFVHRVGRTARAGSSGWSYNLVQSSDVPYLLDLQLFLGMPLKLGRREKSECDFATELTLGTIPRIKLEQQVERIASYIKNEEHLSTLQSVAEKGNKLYVRTRNSASAESAKRSKGIVRDPAMQQSHPIYSDKSNEMDIARDEMLNQISKWRPRETIFELNNKGTAVADVSSMMRKRKAESIAKAEQKSNEKPPDGLSSTDSYDKINILPDYKAQPKPDEDDLDMSDVSEDELEVIFGSSKTSKPKEDSWKDSEYFMSYEPRNSNLAEDRGYGVRSGSTWKNSNFVEAARDVTMELTNDESKSFAEPSRMRWDKRGKKYVSRSNDEDGSKGRKMIRGESGQKIAASFRSGRFDEWRKANRVGRLPRTGEMENASSSVANAASKRYRHNAEQKPKRLDKYRDDYFKKKKKQELKSADEADITKGRVMAKKSEIKSIEDIRRQRKLKERRREKNARPARRAKL